MTSLFYDDTRLCAHSPLICVCHLAVDVKALTAVPPLFAAVSVRYSGPPGTAEKNNAALAFLSADASRGKTGREEGDGKGN